MDGCLLDVADSAGILDLAVPSRQRQPVVLASPHSGRDYRPSFLRSSRLDPLTLRRSEDGFVDQIFDTAAVEGAPLLKALFPRAYLDTNREAFELDPEMFVDPLPSYVNTRSPRVAAGLGTIARVVAQGTEIYNRKLRFTEAVGRIERCYRPYHETLRRLVETTRQRFGACLLIDCHSMPSAGGAGDHGAGASKVDFVLGDCYGSSCSALFVNAAERFLTQQGYLVGRNAPYAGGYTTRHYGRPRQRVHAMQIEINRALYMDEAAMTPKPFITTLSHQMADMVAMLGRLAAAEPAAA